MTYVVKDGTITRLRAEPLATADSKKVLFQGTELGDPAKSSDGFLFFEIGGPLNDALKGWVFKDDCEESSERLPVNEVGFVQECVNVQLGFNATEEIKPGVPMSPALVSCDFLVARAIFETAIENFGKKILGSDGVGPLQVTTAEWKDFTDNGGVLAVGARDSDRDHPVLQIEGAAFRQHTDGQAMSKLRLDAGKAMAADPFVPSFLDMFFAYVTNSPAAALAILDAQSAGVSPDTSIKDVLKDALTPTQMTALFQAREKLPGSSTVFFGTEASPSPLKTIVDLAEATLQQLLTDAFTKVKQDRPDMIPAVTPGGAPWMTIAETLAAGGVVEGTNDDQIRLFFQDTDFGPVARGTVPPWCGAFAAHCMKSSGNATVAASVPKGAAAAANWKNWGAELPSQSETIPTGAVVVLSPPPEGGSSHVGFFIEFSADKKTVTLLGGNQSHRVGKVPFAASRIAAIRWLDLPGAAGAVDIAGITLPADKVKAANRPNAKLILDAFAAAGYGRNQQIAALANAIDESGLDASQDTEPEGSIGLFQLRRFKGVGGNHSIAELQNPDFNTQLIIAEAKKVPQFAEAPDLRSAVDAFVRFVEKPKDKAGQSAQRFKTASALIATASA